MPIIYVRFEELIVGALSVDGEASIRYTAGGWEVDGFADLRAYTDDGDEISLSGVALPALDAALRKSRFYRAEIDGEVAFDRHEQLVGA